LEIDNPLECGLGAYQPAASRRGLRGVVLSTVKTTAHGAGSQPLEVKLAPPAAPLADLVPCIVVLGIGSDRFWFGEGKTQISIG
jgi:hypothetical protein